MGNVIPHRKYRNLGYIDSYAKRWSKKAEDGIWEKTLDNKNSYVNRNKSYKDFSILLRDIFEDLNPSSILDVGCGNCIIWRQLNEGESFLKFHGLDVAEGMINLARKDYPHSNFYLGDALDVKDLIPSNKNFDLIFSRGVVLNHMGKEYFSKILNNLHDFSSGALVFDYVNLEYFSKRPSMRKPSFPLYTKGDVLEMIENTKFNNLETKVFYEDKRDPIVVLK